MPVVSRGEVTLHYEREGVSADPVVLVHDAWGDHRSWSELAPLLTRGLDVVVYDRRGHGASHGPARGQPVRNDAEDLAFLLEAIDLYPIHIVAHAYGGAVALRLAHERPEMVRSLVVHEPPFAGLLEGDPATAVEARRLFETARDQREGVQRGDVEGAARQEVERLSPLPKAPERVLREARAGFLANAPAAVEELADPEAMRPDRSLLRDLLLPVLVTTGEWSPPSAHRVDRTLATLLRNAQWRALPEAGHSPHLTSPLRYAGLLLTFFLERNVPVT